MKNRKILLESKSQLPLDQRFPTGGSRTPGGPKQGCRGSKMRFSRVTGCMFLEVLLRKEPKFM